MTYTVMLVLYNICFIYIFKLNSYELVFVQAKVPDLTDEKIGQCIVVSPNVYGYTEQSLHSL